MENKRRRLTGAFDDPEEAVHVLKPLEMKLEGGKWRARQITCVWCARVLNKHIKTKYVCMHPHCTLGGERGYCHPDSGRRCFANHLRHGEPEKAAHKRPGAR